MLTAVINALGSLLKIFGFGLRNIFKSLWIAVDQRKPRALDLHHDAMAATESVIDAGQIEIDRGRLIRHERLRLFKTIAKFRAVRLAANQLLVSTHVRVPGIRVGI